MSRLLLALALLVGLPAPSARADGCLLPKVAAADIAEPEQKAVGVLRRRARGSDPAGPLFRGYPGPSSAGSCRCRPSRRSRPPPATSSSGSAAARRSRTWLRRTGWPACSTGRRRRSISMRSAGVEVVRRDTLGVYDTVTLAAPRRRAPQSWLKEDDFRVPRRRRPGARRLCAPPLGTPRPCASCPPAGIPPRRASWPGARCRPCASSSTANGRSSRSGYRR